jgi:soluble lytic murein transglycosylase-like protein
MGWLFLFLLVTGGADAGTDHNALIERATARYPYYVAEKGYRIHPALVRAIIMQESRGDPKAVSPVGARGLMQIMPRTAELLGCAEDRLFEPEENIGCGVRFVAALLTYTKGDLIRALSGYNGGSHSTEKSPLLGGRIADNPETRNYVRQVLLYYERFKGETVPAKNDAGKRRR